MQINWVKFVGGLVSVSGVLVAQQAQLLAMIPLNTQHMAGWIFGIAGFIHILQQDRLIGAASNGTTKP